MRKFGDQGRITSRRLPCQLARVLNGSYEKLIWRYSLTSHKRESIMNAKAVRRTVIGYATVAAGYAIFVAGLLAGDTPRSAMGTLAQSLAGPAFVLVTSFVIYLLMRSTHYSSASATAGRSHTDHPLQHSETRLRDRR